jgi:hypothetical protein
MSPDADPPLAGEDGAQRPGEEPSTPPEPAPKRIHPMMPMSRRARRLRMVMARQHRSYEGNLSIDLDRLHALFTDILMNSPETTPMEERHALIIALRAQKQALATYLALRELQALVYEENPPP